MSVLIETSIGDITVDLDVDQCPEHANNFLKLCKRKFYHGSIFINIEPESVAEVGHEDGRSLTYNQLFNQSIRQWKRRNIR